MDNTLSSAVDRLLGTDVQVALMLEIAQRLQGADNPRLKSFGANLHRHARGVQVTIAAVRQELTHNSV